jgi:hypothetical protein
LAESWAIRRASVDDDRFGPERVGPYRLGPLVRKTPFGEAVLGLADHGDQIVEIDFLHLLAGSPLAGPDGKLMADLTQVVGLQHRHLVPLVGTGFADGTPYLVRPHRPGRTWSEHAAQTPKVDPGAAAAIAFAVADAIEFLAAQGSQPGACAMGGFDGRDVLLAFDGSVALIGLGLKQARGAHDALAADQGSLAAFLEKLDSASGLDLAATAAAAPEAAARAIRRRHAESCGHSRALVGRSLRRAFDDAIREARAFFGLPSLQ